MDSGREPLSEISTWQFEYSRARSDSRHFTVSSSPFQFTMMTNTFGSIKYFRRYVMWAFRVNESEMGALQSLPRLTGFCRASRSAIAGGILCAPDGAFLIVSFDHACWYYRGDRIRRNRRCYNCISPDDRPIANPHSRHNY